MRVILWFLAAVLLALVSIAAPAAAQQGSGRRVALVVGNAGYRSVDRLPNPANDARLIAATLKAAGFALLGDGPQIDVDKPHFDRLVQDFGRAVQGAEVALFYYAGHGMQVQGVNWLVPVDANPTAPRDLDFQMVDANLVLRQMEDAGTKLNLVILDACRSNPFGGGGLRGTGGGLAEMQAPEGTLISYATQPGNVAADGAGADSPYTLALADAIRQPGLDVFRIFNRVGLAVKQATGGTQLPWLASSPISGNFYFFTGPTTIVMPAPAAPAPYAPAPIVPAIAPARGAFDGSWMVYVLCDDTPDALGYNLTFTGTVEGGHFHGEHGVKGEANSFDLDGTIEADGTAKFFGAGLTGPSKYSVRQAAQGSTYFYHASGHFAGGLGEAKRTETRPCTLTFKKQ
jgi:hypothetical protein